MILCFGSINAQTGIITTVAGNGQGAYSGDGGLATQASLNDPNSVTMDAAGNLYISDAANYRIRRVAPGGIITTIAGNGTRENAGDGGLAIQASFFNPAGLAVDTAGNLYISEVSFYRIRKVTPGGIITTVAGNGQGAYSGDGGLATQASLYSPEGVAVDAAGNLYVADASNNGIRKVTPAGIITTVAGGRLGNSGDGGAATAASLDHPSGVAVDAAGNLYIADANNNRIRKVVPGGIITTVAGSGSRGDSGDGGPATAASLTTPRGVSLDAAGNLYIVDWGNHRIRKVTPGGIITTVAGNGQGAYSGDGGLATQASLNFPSSVVVDAAGNLYIADLLNHRIRKVTFSSTTTCTPPSITAQPQSQTIPTGQSITLAVTASGTSLTYQWYQGVAGDTKNFVGSGPTFTTPPLSSTASYWVRVTNGCSTVDSATATISIGGTPSSALTSGLVAYYPEDAQNAHPDVTGTSPGTVAAGNPTFVTGKLRGAYDYQGADNENDPRVHSTLPNVATWRAGTIAVWVKPIPYAGGNLQTIFQIEEGDNYGHLWGSIHPVTRKFIFQVGTGADGVSTISTTTITNAWYFLVASWDSDANRATVSVNGTQEASSAIPTWGTQGNNFYWGAGFNGFGMRGTIDELGIWNRVLTTAEITSLYNNGTGTSYPFASTPICSLSCTAMGPSNGAANATLSFSATATASSCPAAPSFAWTFGDGTGSTQQNPSHVYPAAGTYAWGMTASITNGPSCAKNGTVSVAPACQPPQITNQPQGQTILAGQTTTLSVTAAGTSPTYQWYRGNPPDTSNPVPGATGASLAISPSATTAFWVRITNTCGSANSTTATVTVTTPLFSLSGTITGAAATLTIKGPNNYTDQRSVASGATYTFTGLTNGTYTLTPTATGYTFTPPSLPVTIAGANVANMNFTATPLPSSGIEIIGYEVTQGLQNLRNSVTLIEGKSTVVRVHVRSTRDEIAVSDGKLIVQRVSGTGNRDPVTITSRRVTVLPNPSRSNNANFMFDLPSALLSGTIQLEFASASYTVTSKAPKTQPCEWDFAATPLTRRCTVDAGPPDTTIQVSFSASPRIKIRLGSIGWKGADGVEHWPVAEDFENTIHDLEVMYPVARVEASYSFTIKPLFAHQPRSAADFATLASSVEEQRLYDGCLSLLGCADLYLGLLRGDDSGNLSSGDREGQAWVLGKGAAAYASDKTPPHELGHLLGLSHVRSSATENPPQCSGKEFGTNASYPYPDGLISPDQSLLYPSPDVFWGYHLIGEYAPKPYDGDIMTYCASRWISDYTYDYLRQRLSRLFGNATSVNGANARGETKNSLGLAADSPQDVLLITGTVKRDLSSAVILGIQGQQGPSVAPGGDGVLRFVVLDRNGVELASYPFEALADPDVDETLRFAEMIPRPAGLARLEIVASGRVIADRTASANPPVVRMTSPAGGEFVGESGIRVRWTASDPDGDPLTFALQYSPDGGDNWNTVATNLSDPFADIDRRQLRPSERGLFRVLASDGLLSAQAQTGAFFRVAATTPTASIASPLSGSTLSALDVVTLMGSGFDPQEGVLSDANLSWSSDLAGVLGTGRTLQLAARRLAPGTHRLTLTTRNSMGVSGTVTIAVTVDAGMVAAATPKFTVYNGASFTQTPLAPGTIATLFGTNLMTGVSGVVAAQTVVLPRDIQGTSVLLDGEAAPLYALADVSGGEQVNFQVPYEVTPNTTIQMVVRSDGVPSDPVDVPIVAATPAVFTSDGTTGIIVHSATNQLVTPGSPAKPGEIVVLYAAGLGAVAPAGRTGIPASLSELSYVVNPASVTIGGLSARVLFAGLAPGYAGLYQINAEVPAAIGSGNLGVTVIVAGQRSKSVTMAAAGAGPACTYSVSPLTMSFVAAGGNGAAGVVAPSGCAWTAATSATWITLTSSPNGNGNGSVTYAVGANATSAGRSGVVTIAGRDITVSQAGASSVPSSILKVSGDGQSVLLGQEFAQPLEVAVANAQGAPVAGVMVTFVAVLAARPDTIVSQFGPLTTAADGRAQVLAGLIRSALIPGAGTYTVTASTGALSVAFSLAVRTGQPSFVKLVSGGQQTAVPGKPFASPLVVEVDDTVGLPVSGVTVSWQASGPVLLSPASDISFQRGNSITDALGRASINAIAASILGTGTVTASILGGASVSLTLVVQAGAP